MSNEAQQANNAFGIPDQVVAPGEGTKVERDAFGLRKQYKKLTIYEDRAPGAESICKLGINGRVVKVQRGKPVILSVDYVGVLDAAVEAVLVQGEGEIITRPALRFPYQIHGDATEAEYKAFQEAMRKEQAARALQAAA